ncbi:MAG TPA: hypothetical protein VH560_09645 [Polyangia bacterium]|jgi:hypothetical protein|nr:hypothetical protein [Polyangia bacterium]
MKRVSTGAFVIATLSLLASGSARADEQAQEPAFGRAHGFAISAERLFGFVHAETTTTMNGIDNTETFNSFSLLGNGSGDRTIYSLPRVGFDWFVVRNLSLGASVSYFRLSDAYNNNSVNGDVVSGVLLAPRVGYAIPLSRVASLWPRVGLTLAHFTDEYKEASSTGSGTVTETATTNLYALTIEVPLVLTVAPHLFVTAAPILDLGLGGSSSLSGNPIPVPDNPMKATNLGILAGMGGFF